MKFYASISKNMKICKKILQVKKKWYILDNRWFKLGNNILKYLFVIFVIGLIGFGVYRMTKSEKEENSESVDQTSTVNTIQTDLRLAICEFDTINPLLTNKRNVQEISKMIYLWLNI